MVDLDFLIEQAIFTGRVESGTNPQLALRQTTLPTTVLASIVGKNEGTAVHQTANRWTDEEHEFLRDNLGRLSTEEIANKLGRTPTAIKIRWTRMGFDAPSKRQHEFTGRQVARLLGTDIHTICKLIARGILPGRMLPGRRRIRVVEKKALLRWLLQPANWLYFKAERIRNPHWRAMVLRRQEAWGDEWWSVGQVEAYHGLKRHAVNNAINQGRIPAVRWGNWWVLRSDAIAYRPHIGGKGAWTRDEWSVEGDAFLILGRAVGLRVSHLAALRGEHWQRTRYRLACLMADPRRLRGLVETYRLPIVVYGPMKKGRWGVFADWRAAVREGGRLRVPSIGHAVGRYLDQGRLSPADKFILIGVLQSWAAYFAYEEGDSELKALAKKMRHWQANVSEDLLAEAYAVVQRWAEPLDNIQRVAARSIVAVDLVEEATDVA